MCTIEDIGVPVKLVKSFPLVRETLERMGFRDRKKKLFFPSCYCIETEDGNYRVVHFKELFLLEGKESTYSKLDGVRRDTIIYFLVKWGLVETETEIDSILQDKIDVLSHPDKKEYRIKHKFVKTRKLNGRVV